MNVIYDGQVAIGGFQDSAFLVRNHLAHFEIIHRPAVQFQRQPFGDDSQCGKIAGFDVAPICRMVRQQLDGVAVLRRVQRRREGFVCTAIRAVRFCHGSRLNDRLVDREFHGIRPFLIVVLSLAGLGINVICAGLADCSVFVDCRNDITALILRIPSECLVLRIVICHRGVFRSTADRQQRKKLFAHRASRLGKRYGQIWIGLVDGAADRKRFLARLELVLRCGLADQRDLYSDGMITRVRRIEGLLGGKVRSFREFKRICAVRELRCAERNHAAVRRTVIAAANGIGLSYEPDLRKRVRFGIGLFAFARVGRLPVAFGRGFFLLLLHDGATLRRVLHRLFRCGGRRFFLLLLHDGAALQCVLRRPRGRGQER